MFRRVPGGFAIIVWRKVRRPCRTSRTLLLQYYDDKDAKTNHVFHQNRPPDGHTFLKMHEANFKGARNLPRLYAVVFEYVLLTANNDKMRPEMPARLHHWHYWRVLRSPDDCHKPTFWRNSWDGRGDQPTSPQQYASLTPSWSLGSTVAHRYPYLLEELL